VELLAPRGSGGGGGGGGGNEGGAPPVHSTLLLHAVQERYLVMPPLAGSAWHGGFTHVCTYGAGFYSYLFAAVISAALWQRLFAGDPFCARGGELLRRELLAHGGAKDPAALLRTVLLEARRRLVHVAAPVSALAYELGFEDPAYFCRFFKRHVGRTPTQWRREQRERLASAADAGSA
jgi:AraC-like DNA-binding protein